MCGKLKRNVPSDFHNPELYPSLTKMPTQRCPHKDAIYCVSCVLFGTQTTILTTEPLTDWSNAKKTVTKHQKTKNHEMARQTHVDFLRVCANQQRGVFQQMTKAHEHELSRNTNALEAIVSLIITCGKQNVAIRGKTDDRSNFMAFLNY